jgi:hypothetical protein
MILRLPTIGTLINSAHNNGELIRYAAGNHIVPL